MDDDYLYCDYDEIDIPPIIRSSPKRKLYDEHETTPVLKKERDNSSVEKDGECSSKYKKEPVCETSEDFEVCSNLLEKVVKSDRETAHYSANCVFKITKLHYSSSFLYIFLTGNDNVQYYFKTYCPIYSYKLCTHRFQSCRFNCQSYKSLVVTGLKSRECHRVNVIKMERSKCSGEKYLLDEMCNDVNRVQMQTGIYEGDYVRFKDGITVDENGCATGAVSELVKVTMEELTQPIDPIVGSYDLETFTDGMRFSNSEVDPIITISYVLRKQNNNMSRYCFINTNGKRFRLNDVYLANAEYCDGKVIVAPFNNERDMLVTFLEVLWRTNPDEILDYNGDKFDIPYIIGRMKKLNIDEQFIQRYDLPKVSFKVTNIRTKFGYGFNSHSMVYYNHLDIYQFIKSSYDASKMENMKLDTAATFYLNVGKVELSVKEMMTLYHEGSFGKVVKYNVRDSILPLEIFFKCQVANKLYADAGIMYLCRDDYLRTISHKINLALFSRSIYNRNENGDADPYFYNKFDLNKIMGRKKSMARVNDDDDDDGQEAAAAEEEGEEIDFTNLSRSHVPLHLIPPDARKLCPLKTRMKYTGGKVLSPNPGYYETTFTLDFSQLYTSIMIYITACLSNLFFGSDGYLYLQHNENAVTTKFLKEMASKRAIWKQEMKKHAPGSFTYNLYDSWQNAAKLVCNSQYGWFGMFCKPLANLITQIGREKLGEAKEKIECLSGNEEIMKKWNLTKMKLSVVYGDTDSNFVAIDLEPEEFKRLGVDGLKKMILQDILAPVNAVWGGSFKMELENIMKCMLIKGKKMYMCLKENGSLYKRGFNVKKDSPPFLRIIFDNVIKRILTNHSLDCVLKNMLSELKTKRDEFCAKKCDQYSFSQTLNEDKKTTIAYKLYMELKESSNTKYIPASGDRIPYILEDKRSNNVKDKAWPTQIFEDQNPSWNKHLGIVCTFLNDIMSMLRNDTLFVYTFQIICDYYQKDQVYDIVYPVLKVMTQSKIKDIMCKELNVKDKKKLDEKQMEDCFERGVHKYIHTHEFTMSKTPPKYRINVEGFNDDCPACNGRGISAVKKNMSLELIENEVSKKGKKKIVNKVEEKQAVVVDKKKLVKEEVVILKKRKEKKSVVGGKTKLIDKYDLKEEDEWWLKPKNKGN
ncbi:ORF101 [Agrotis segetum granulovirus]|uniref:DNA-directed DNA polymerase n=1 Tax=Agrotis segetum granulosis virus TaxID=10464 RepID=Q6QXG1_GVAS|nr:ORF101 [Agrotis segetum granulovirus]